jgi:hypothetical protein
MNFLNALNGGRWAMRHGRSVILAALALSVAGAWQAATLRAQDDAPPPNGFEERSYNIADLTRRPASLSMEDQAEFDREPLDAQDVVEIVKTAVAPDTWIENGLARIWADSGRLMVVQKKEVHDEIAKVLAWLRESAVPPFHATIVATTLKPEALKKFADEAGPIAPAVLLKAIEDAGDAAHTEFVELNGAEGQRIQVSGTERQRYIGDYDVAGAVYDPVMRTAVDGLRIHASGLRMPDGKSVHVDLRVALGQDTQIETATIGISGTSMEPTPPEPFEPGKEKDKKDAKKPNAAGVNFEKQLKLHLPVQTAGGFAASVEAQQGQFALAGTLDLTLTGNGERLAIFVRASIGKSALAPLQGVSGLKGNESFRLYPALALTQTENDYPGPNFSLRSMPDNLILGSPQTMVTPATANANMATPTPPPPSIAAVIELAQNQFQTRQNPNKVIIAAGSFVFARLTAEDHAKLLKLMTDGMSLATGRVRTRALALAVSPETARKLLFADTRTFDDAALTALAAANGSMVLLDEVLSLGAGQRSHVFAGQLREYLSDYNINGDSYDPSVDHLLERGFTLDLRPMPSTDKAMDVEVRLQAMPGAASMKRTNIDGYTVNSGAQATLILGISAEIDLPKIGMIEMRQTVRAPKGLYVLAGSARMPAGADGKADPRQALLFIRADNGEK